MKKKCTAVLAMLAAICLLAGCGSADITALKDVKVEKYVKLGEYKGLPVTITAAKEVDEEEWNEKYLELYVQQINKENAITDRAVKEGDTVVLDYEGKFLGIALEGGSAKNYQLTVGSDTFIEGFEDGLIGAKPGRTFDMDLTFPSDYRSDSLAGKDTVFTVTVRYIIPSEPSDDVVASLNIEGVTNHKELRQYAYDLLADELNKEYHTKVETEVLERLSENCTYKKFPKALLEKYKANAKAEIEKQAASIGIDVVQLTGLMYQMSPEAFQEHYSDYVVKQSLTLQAIANLENLNVSDEELDALLAADAAKAGAASVEDYLGETDKETFRENYMFDKVLDFLIENASVAE